MRSEGLRQVRIGAQLLEIEYPEFWVILLCAAAWLALLSMRMMHGTYGIVCAMDGGMAGTSIPMRGVSSRAVALLEMMRMPALHWLIMIPAMMAPTLLSSMRVVAGRSLWSRRHRAMAVVLLGYAAPWIVFGLAVEALIAIAPTGIAPCLLAVSLLAAAVWQLVPLKQRSLVYCHREPILAPSGLRADWACLRYGLLLAGRCGTSCWALMITCAAAGHALWITVLITAVVWAERFRPGLPLRWSSAALCCAALLAWGAA
jgi:Predicted metal-binding integral membrane protein (DUF2182)